VIAKRSFEISGGVWRREVENTLGRMGHYAETKGKKERMGFKDMRMLIKRS
jgi:hypothetical protein